MIATSAVYEHEIGRPNFNVGDVRLGIRGVRTGGYFINFHVLHWDLNKYKKTQNFKKYGNRVIQEIETVCIGKPDYSPWHWLYSPTFCDCLEVDDYLFNR